MDIEVFSISSRDQSDKFQFQAQINLGHTQPSPGQKWEMTFFYQKLIVFIHPQVNYKDKQSLIFRSTRRENMKKTFYQFTIPRTHQSFPFLSMSGQKLDYK